MRFSKYNAADDFVRRTLEDIKSDLGNKVGLDNVVLFGSCARGTARLQSDIDIAVFTNDFIKLPGYYKVHWCVFKPGVLDTPIYPIHAAILREGIPLSKITTGE